MIKHYFLLCSSICVRREMVLQQISVLNKSTSCREGWLRPCSPVSLALYKRLELGLLLKH